MAKSIVIRGSEYLDVPGLNIPKSDGSGDAVFYETSGADLSSNDLRQGVTGYGPNGEVHGNQPSIEKFNVEIAEKGEVVSIPAGIHGAGSSVAISAADQAAIVSANIRDGVSILGTVGTLKVPVISQDSSTKIVRIS